MQLIKRRDKRSQQDSVDSQESIKRVNAGLESVEKISQLELLHSLEQLNTEFKEFQKIRDEIRARISSITLLIPILDEKKNRLIQETDEKRNKAELYDGEIPELQQQNAKLLLSISKNQEQKALLEQLIRFDQDKLKANKSLIRKRTREKKKIVKVLRAKLDEIYKIDEQIAQIKDIQDHGEDLVSMLFYASKKDNAN